MKGFTATEWEISRAILLLEQHGYIVRKPSEATIPVVLEVMPPKDTMWEIGVRADLKINGVHLALQQTCPADMLLSRDRPDFRENHLPKIFAQKLAHYIADKMVDGLAEQVKAKIEPLIPPEPMTLEEIVSFIAEALYTSKHRIDPAHFDENDNLIITPTKER